MPETMKLYIERVATGAEYEGKIANFYITGKMSSGVLIQIFDYECYDLRAFKNQEVECLILAFLVDIVYSGKIDQKPNEITERIKGAYIKNYKIPSEWKKKWKRSHIYEGSPAFLTQDGLFLLESQDFETISIRDRKELILNDGQELVLHVGRFDLLDWHPIE